MTSGGEGSSVVVNFRMSGRAVALVDAEAKGRGVGRSEMFRRLVAAGMKAEGVAGSAMPLKGVAPHSPVDAAFRKTVYDNEVAPADDGGVPW